MSILLSRRHFLALPFVGAIPALRQPMPPGYKLDLPTQSIARDCSLAFILEDSTGSPASLPNGPYTADFGVYSLHGLRLLRATDMSTTVDTSTATVTVAIPLNTMKKYPIRFTPTAQYRLLITDNQRITSPLFYGLFPVGR